MGATLWITYLDWGMVIAYRCATLYGVQGKRILGLHKTYYEMYPGETKGGKREGSRQFGGGTMVRKSRDEGIRESGHMWARTDQYNLAMFLITVLCPVFSLNPIFSYFSSKRLFILCAYRFMSGWEPATEVRLWVQRACVSMVKETGETLVSETQCRAPGLNQGADPHVPMTQHLEWMWECKWVWALVNIKPDKLMSRWGDLASRHVSKGETMGVEVAVGDQGNPNQLKVWVHVFVWVWQGEIICIRKWSGVHMSPRARFSRDWDPGAATGHMRCLNLPERSIFYLCTNICMHTYICLGFFAYIYICIYCIKSKLPISTTHSALLLERPATESDWEELETNTGRRVDVGGGLSYIPTACCIR